MSDDFKLKDFDIFGEANGVQSDWEEQYRKSILPSGFEVLDFYIDGFQKKSVWILYSPEQKMMHTYAQNVRCLLEGRSKNVELVSGNLETVSSVVSGLNIGDVDLVFLECLEKKLDIEVCIRLAREYSEKLNVPIVILCPKEVVSNAFPSGEYSVSGFRKYIEVRKQVNGILAMTRSKESDIEPNQLEVDMSILYQRNGPVYVNIGLEYDKIKQNFTEKKGQLDNYVKEKNHEV